MFLEEREAHQRKESAIPQSLNPADGISIPRPSTRCSKSSRVNSCLIIPNSSHCSLVINNEKN